MDTKRGIFTLVQSQLRRGARKSRSKTQHTGTALATPSQHLQYKHTGHLVLASQFTLPPSPVITIADKLLRMRTDKCPKQLLLFQARGFGTLRICSKLISWSLAVRAKEGLCAVPRNHPKASRPQQLSRPHSPTDTLRPLRLRQ